MSGLAPVARIASANASTETSKRSLRRLRLRNDRKAPCEPIGKAHLHPKGQRRFPKGDRKALGKKLPKLFAGKLTLCISFQKELQGGFPVAPLTPSAVALQARMWALQGKTILFLQLKSTCIRRTCPKGCRGRSESPLRKPSIKVWLLVRRPPKGSKGRPESPLGTSSNDISQGIRTLL